jgi:hypothetical protein
VKSESTTGIYGVVAEFDSPERLVKAAERVRDAGYTHTDALTPFPVHGIIDALGVRHSRMSGLVLTGGAAGFCIGLGLQYWVSSVAYPHIVAGRPFFSWPNFVPIIFECTVLVAALTGFVGMLARNSLPRPYHPVFAAPRVEGSTTHTFMIVVEATDPKFDAAGTPAFLKEIGADHVAAAPFEPSGEGQTDGKLMG